jgi:hypothetical protein
MPRVVRCALSLAILAATAVLAAPGYAFDNVFQQTYPLSAGAVFQLQNVNGSVNISAWERDQVEVYALKSTQGDPRDLDRVQIEVQSRGDTLAVDTRYPQDDGVEVYVEYHIRVPQHCELRRVSTVNGFVRVFGVEGSGDLRTVNGGVEVFDSAGRFSAHTTNGNLRLELRGMEGNGPVVLETVNGSVELGLPASAGADVEVRSLNGDFRSELPVLVKDSLDARGFRGRLGPGGSTLHIHTVNGAIRIVSLRGTV